MTIGKFLEKIPTDQIYEDVFKPGLKKAGEALSTVLDVGNCVLLPIKLLNERSKLIFSNNMRRYQEKLEKINDDEISQVPEYVGIPILEKLAYLSEENISEAFINLLTKASTQDTLKLVHPAFVSTLNDLSSDEAKLLFFLKDSDKYPFIDIFIIREIENTKKPAGADIKGPKTREELLKLVDYSLQDRQTTKLKTAWNLTGLENKVNLDFPDNMELYLNNLERQKLIDFNREQYLMDRSDEYDGLEEFYAKHVKTAKDAIADQLALADNIFLLKIKIEKGFFEFTDYGKAFVEACIADIKNEV